ncbi:MAG TPA: glycosyltransferase family 39 protein [Thermoanaerobaculia bacterium]
MQRILAIAALAAFFVLAIGNIVATSPTYDETTHLVAGYSYLKTGDYRLNPEHPPLLKMLASVPLLTMDVWFSEAGRGASTYAMLREAWAMAIVNIDAQWRASQLVLYGLDDATLQRLGATPLAIPTTMPIAKGSFLNDSDAMFVRARIMMALLGVALGALIFLWSRELWGAWGGVVSVVLFAFDPNFIAHSGLVTTDVGIALLMFACVYFFWRWSRNPTRLHAAGFVLAFALAQVAKFSAVILIPIVIVLALRQQRKVKAAIVVGIAAVVTLLAIWGAYSFRYSAAKDPEAAANEEQAVRTMLTQRELDAPESFPRGYFPLREVVQEWAAKEKLADRYPSGVPGDVLVRERNNVQLGFARSMMLTAAEKKLLPEAYLFGAAWVGSLSVFRSSYLDGEFSDRGFSGYFFKTFLYKTPLAAIVAIVAGLYFARRKAGPFLFWPVVIYLGFSLLSNLNIGHRHILPIFPFLYVACGSLAEPLLKQRRAVAAVAALLIVIAPVIAWGHHLSYMNVLGGWDKLSDSNFDWGQDLPRLAEWTRANNVTEPINLVYFGTADPKWYGIRYHNLRTAAFPEPQRPGYLAISSVDVIGLMFPPERRGHWRTWLDTHKAQQVGTAGKTIFIYRVP